MDSGVDSVAGSYIPVPRPSAVRYPAPTRTTIIAPIADLYAAPIALSIDHAPAHSERSERAIRALNFTVAMIALVALLPVFLVIGLIVKFTSPGPVIYRQIRVGMDRRRTRTPSGGVDRRGIDAGGRPFTMYKFRSMRIDAEKHGIVWATKNDSRATPIGRFLRLSRLDELPQLINVLFGDMNVVGPRPERPSIFNKLRGEIDHYALRQRARPGITGWAQINQGYDNTISDVRKKVAYDLAYIQSRSLAQDLSIMARTIPVMLFKRGAH